MKSLLIITIGFLLASVCAIAQPGFPGKDLPTKGYYAIGDNYKKLRRGSIANVDTIASPSIHKGFYSMKHKNKRFKINLGWNHGNRKVPTVSKGYYAIGNNARKLIE